MCGISDIKFKDDEIELGFGWGHWGLSIGDTHYGVETLGDAGSRIQMSNKLNKYTKKDLIEIILQLTENGAEG